ncbi:hypothetical protein PAXRUDRAFT_161429 [Paxillus rubicundulus Ve08.2h10]|uniref:Uncharacterized protein n=1 Tax=Paxillus rubicundulus Ve08.2h10 TaxID=930991 RepID=A0A0D0DLY0_9AGAM|nr:hypothetical protein PAXRUDRAFT_161429 [Paxillus rubicundulus Ve08.2h10]
MHDIAALKERCKTLEMQLFKVAAEHDVLKATLDQLAASLGSSTPPPPGSIKAAEMYPKMQFWMQTKYNEWTNTAEAHGNHWWKLTYLEDGEGNTISDDLLKGIHKKIQGIWAKLVEKDMAPKTWGKATVSAKELVYTHIYKVFPFLQQAESDWKLDLLCGNNYPGWYRNNGQGKSPADQEVKEEDNADADTDTDELGTETSKKWKATSKRCKSEVVEKRMKG